MECLDRVRSRSACDLSTSDSDLIHSGWGGGSLGLSRKAIRTDLTGGQFGRSPQVTRVMGVFDPHRPGKVEDHPERSLLSLPGLYGALPAGLGGLGRLGRGRHRVGASGRAEDRTPREFEQDLTGVLRDLRCAAPGLECDWTTPRSANQGRRLGHPCGPPDGRNCIDPGAHVHALGIGTGFQTGGQPVDTGSQVEGRGSRAGPQQSNPLRGPGRCLHRLRLQPAGMT